MTREEKSAAIEELKEELEDNLFLFFRVSSQGESDKIEKIDDKIQMKI